MSGLDMIALLRARAMQVPILVVSADTDPATPAAALRMGANAFFAKPFSPAAVRRRLEELIDGGTAT
jgi:DNA-binding response OmpR family regulator